MAPSRVRRAARLESHGLWAVAAVAWLVLVVLHTGGAGQAGISHAHHMGAISSAGAESQALGGIAALRGGASIADLFGMFVAMTFAMMLPAIVPVARYISA